MRTKHRAASAGLAVFIGFSLSGCRQATSGQDDSQGDVARAVREAAGTAKPQQQMLTAGALRDKVAAQELIKKYLDDAKNKKNHKPGLEQSEIIRVLVLDHGLPELHLALAESYLADVQSGTFKGLDGVPPEEFAWQEIEWFRLRGTDSQIEARLEAIRRRLPPRPPESTKAIPPDVLSAAQKTFAEGKAFHIDYPANKPIEFQVGNAYSLNMPVIRIRYLRSPYYPPHGCRVVASMLVSKDGGKPECKAMHRNYESCAFPSGLLEATYLTLGEVKVNADTKILVHVESLFEAGGKQGVVLSNILSIPVVAEKSK